jgi:hypothetical protein
MCRAHLNHATLPDKGENLVGAELVQQKAAYEQFSSVYPVRELLVLYYGASGQNLLMLHHRSAV